MNKDNRDKIVTIIVGAGKAGELLVGDILSKIDSGVEILGYVDDDVSKQDMLISSLPVLGTLSDLPSLVAHYKVEELILAIPSERGTVVRGIINATAGQGLRYKIIPHLSEVLLQDYREDYIRYLKYVGPEDLLGGEILKSDQDSISVNVKNKTFLVTGAAGSIGSELSRQITAYGPGRIVLYDWWENGMFDLRNKILREYPNIEVVYVIGDIKDRMRLDQVISSYMPNTIFHAAAYKHVPLMESNASEAIKNNILGTKTVGELAIKYNVEKFVLVSTDKAVNPTNVMGATKRAAEQVIHTLSKSKSRTAFCSVRFGNVINSNGSAIPIFQKQIEQGGPVTVTHKDVTRFFMTIPEAVHLILQAWILGKNNDLFVLDMGEPIKIYDLARLLIIMEGYIPDEEIKIDIVGLRPGEKLYEEVLVDQESTMSTSVKKIFKTKTFHDFDAEGYFQKLGQLLDDLNTKSMDLDFIKKSLKSIVSTYTRTDN